MLCSLCMGACTGSAQTYLGLPPPFFFSCKNPGWVVPGSIRGTRRLGGGGGGGGEVEGEGGVRLRGRGDR